MFLYIVLLNQIFFVQKGDDKPIRQQRFVVTALPLPSTPHSSHYLVLASMKFTPRSSHQPHTSSFGACPQPQTKSHPRKLIKRSTTPPTSAPMSPLHTVVEAADEAVVVKEEPLAMEECGDEDVWRDTAMCEEVQEPVHAKESIAQV